MKNSRIFLSAVLVVVFLASGKLCRGGEPLPKTPTALHLSRRVGMCTGRDFSPDARIKKRA